MAFSLIVAVANRFPTLGFALAAAMVGLIVARLRPATVLKRMIPLNLFMLLVLVLVPLTAGGTPLATLGPLHYTEEGFLLAARIVFKGNVIVLLLVALLGTLDITTLGHVLSHLYVPDKLTHLLLLTVRYVDVLRREYLRLSAAMKMRGFKARMNLHTYRTYGYLVGMLLVRSLDRSERILAAMKCRGFRGRFYLLDHFAFSARDLWFGVGSTMVLLVLAVLEWS